MSAPPPIDGRTVAELARQTEQLAQHFSGWTAPTQGTDLGRTLIAVFADMAGQVVDRLNQVPERDQLAFFDLLGVTPLAARAARVPLRFTLADGQDGVLVPAGTAVAPSADAGAPEVLFETERDVTLVAARVATVVAHEPGADRAADVTASATTGIGASFAAFRGDTLIEHALYLAHDTFTALPSPRRLTIALDFADAAARDAFARLAVAWEGWDGTAWVPVAPAGVGPGGPEGATGWTVPLGDVAPPPATTVAGRTAAWFRGRTTRALPLAGGVPTLRAVSVRAVVDQAAAPAPDKAFSDAAVVDLSRDVYPFGEYPRYNQSFAIRSDVLARPGARASFDVRLSDPLPTLVRPSANLVLAWEVGGADGWVEVGRSTPTPATGAAAPPAGAFRDGTNALSASGVVSFAVPAVGGPLTLNGETGWWLRARILAGNYGEPATFRVEEKTTVPVAATFGPPSVRRVAVAWSFDRTEPPEDALTINDGIVAAVGAAPAGTPLASFVPFVPSPDTSPALYVGFDRPLPNRPIALYWAIDPSNLAPRGPSPVGWEHSTADGGWAHIDVVDETEGLTRTGFVTFVAPAALAPARHLGEERWWLRIVAPPGAGPSPLVRRLVTNTMWAAHAHLHTGEVIGWAGGVPGGTFVTTQSPVLEGERLEVLASLDAPGEVWDAVPNFVASGALDRHYVLDRSTGTVSFGDGHHGLVPPARSILRITYRSGGGAAGNLPAGAITELRAAVAGVVAVTNDEPSGGGSGSEPLERVRARGPRQLRHGGRAVAASDYEDLAEEASAEVARSRYRPLAINPLDVDWIPPTPVTVVPGGAPVPDASSVLCHAADAVAAARATADPAGRAAVTVVPASDDPQPAPSQGLLDEVRAVLLAARPQALAPERLDVSGPEWVAVTVRTTVATTSLATAVSAPAAVVAALQRFLHPLHGGTDGHGWPFGRLPHRSDLIAVVAAVAGVDHVRTLELSVAPDPAGLSAEQLRTTLVMSGLHTVVVAGVGEAS